MIPNQKNDEAEMMFRAVLAGLAGAAKVLCDRGIISIKPRVQPPEATPEAPHYYTGDYIAESIMVAGDAGFQIIKALDPATQTEQ